MAAKSLSAPVHQVNRQNPATWLKPDESLFGADGRDWSWCYVWFKDVEEFPGYKVEWHGTIWSRWNNSGLMTDRWKRLTPTIRRQGYQCVSLQKDRTSSQVSVHHIVLKAFVGPCQFGMQACHFPDRNRANNRADNLMWGTPKQNQAHRRIHGTDPIGSRNPKAKLSEELAELAMRLYYRGVARQVIADCMGVTLSAIDGIIQGKRWTG